MSQLADSTSDSDSNSSSWVFVNETNAEIKETNKYYLNCSSEPVQELTEKCLNSAGSEIETDSDGISVISESDGAKQILQYDDLDNSSEEIEKETEKEIIESVCDSAVELERAIKLLNTNNEKIKLILWYVIFISILMLALIMPLFLSDDELIINDCETKIDSKFYKCDLNVDVDTVAFNDIPLLNDCQTDVNCNSDLHPKISKIFEDEKADKSYEAEQSDKLYEKSDFSNGNKETNKKLYSNKKTKFNKKIIEKKKKKISDYYKDSNCNLKQENYKSHQYYDKKIKKRQSQLRKLEKSLRKKETELNDMKQQLKNLKFKINKDLDFLQALKKSKYKENKSHLNKEKDLFKMKRFNFSLMGDWYNNLYNERDKIRKQEQMANWIFERAYMRSKKRDKAVWYFNWMTEREQLRFKKDFKQFSY